MEAQFQSLVYVLSSQGAHTVSEVLVQKAFKCWPKKADARSLSRVGLLPGHRAHPLFPRVPGLTARFISHLPGTSHYSISKPIWLIKYLPFCCFQYLNFHRWKPLIHQSHSSKNWFASS